MMKSALNGRSTIGAPPRSTISPWKDAIVEIYRKHQPDRIARVDEILSFYKGEERELYLRICNRYGVKPCEMQPMDVAGIDDSQVPGRSKVNDRHFSGRAMSRPGSGSSVRSERSTRMQSAGHALLRNKSLSSHPTAAKLDSTGLMEASPALPARKLAEARTSDPPAKPRQRLTDSASGDEGQVRRTRATSDWFNELFGFTELNYDATKRQLKISRDTGRRLFLEGPNEKKYKVGCFSTPSLSELEESAKRKGGMSALPGKLRVSNIVADVAALHGDPLNRHATFQVASQFNCLEFVNEDVVPERGITGYVHDHTQGPACSIACGPATCFRNYFADVGGTNGQRRDRQINNLHDINTQLGNPDGRYFTVANGYTKAKDEGLQALNLALENLSDRRKQILRSLLRVGIHEDVQVTSSDWGSWTLHDESQTVTQVFGSACSVSYSGNGKKLWAPFASLVLSGSYEATLYAALLSAIRHQGEHGSNRVYLTSLGGGVFGNAREWIVSAMDEAFRKFADVGLEVYIVSYAPAVPSEFKAFAEQYVAK